MKLSFNKLTIENFKCFIGKPQTLDLSLGEPGLHFVCGENQTSKTGSNGSGKSTVFDSFSWCLYGRTSSGLRNPDIKPWASKSPSRVELCVLIDDTTYTISRLTEPNRLTINDKLASQEEVEALIGLSPEVCFHTILLGQGQPLFLDLTPRDKMKVFQDVLQLARWEERAKAAQERVLTLEREEASSEGEITGLRASLAQIESLLKQNKAQAEEWEAERRNRLRTQDEELKGLQANLTKAENNLAQAKLNSDSAGTEGKALRQEVEKQRTVLANVHREYDRRETEIRVQKREQEKLQAELEILGKSDKCPTCGQLAKGTKLAKHKIEVEAALVRLEIGLDPKLMKGLKTRVEVQERLLNNAIKYQEEFEAKEDEANTRIRRWETEVVQLQAQVKSVHDRKLEQTEQTNPYREQVQTLRKKHSETQTQITELEEQQQILARRIERTKFWVKGFKDVCLHIIEEVLIELEMVSNEMLADIGLGDWLISYDIERETQSGTTQRGLNVMVLGPNNKKAVRWESWSGGEGQRLRIVGALALSEVLLGYAGVQPNLEILDEPTQHLSKEGTQDLCTLLADRAERLGRHIFYVDHQSIASSHFASIITVVKTMEGAHFA